MGSPVETTRYARFQGWEEQIPKDLSTWAATNRHVLSFFSEQLKGIPSGIKSGSKIEESIKEL
jgi:hypothetical protein